MTEILQEEKNSTKATADVPLEARTMVITKTKDSEKAIGPRLVCTSSSGTSKIIPLKKAKLVIGRSVEADLNLPDPLVSRKHCVIEHREGDFLIRNVSTTNPLLLNEVAIAEKRLYTGDQIKIGNTNLAFISDRSEDGRKVEIKPGTQETKSGWGFWFTIFLLLIFAGYFGYFQAYTPLKVKWALKSVSKQLNAKNYDTARSTLEKLLASDLPPEYNHQVMEYLAETALAVTEQKAKYEDLAAFGIYVVLEIGHVMPLTGSADVAEQGGQRVDAVAPGEMGVVTEHDEADGSRAMFSTNQRKRQPLAQFR